MIIDAMAIRILSYRVREYLDRRFAPSGALRRTRTTAGVYILRTGVIKRQRGRGRAEHRQPPLEGSIFS